MISLTPEQTQLVADQSVANGINPSLAFNIIQQESGGNHYDANGGVLTSPKGALGFGQLEPGTAKDMGVDPTDPNQNLIGTVRYIKTLSDKYQGDNQKVAQAYNWGGSNVDNGGPVPASVQTYANNASSNLGDGVDPAIASAVGPQSQEVDPAIMAAVQGDPMAPKPGDPHAAVGADTGEALNEAQTNYVKANRDKFDLSAAPGSQNLPRYLKSQDEMQYVNPGEYYLDTQGVVGQKPFVPANFGDKVYDAGLGFAQSAMKPLNNAALFVDSVGQDIGLPNGGTAKAIDTQNNWFQQQMAGHQPNAVAKFAGDVAGTLPFMAAGGNLTARVGNALPAAAPVAQWASQGLPAAMIGGAAGGALTTDKRDPFGVMMDMGMGAGGGAAFHGLVRGAGNFLSPQLSAAAQTMRDGNVQLTPGGVLGGAAKSMEDKATSFPVFFAGDSIQAGQRASVRSFNTGTANQILAPIGATVPAGIEAGHDLVSHVGDRIGAVYDSILPHVSLTPDTQLGQDLSGITSRVMPTLPPTQQAQLQSILTDNILSKANGSTMTGANFKLMDSNLGRLASQFSKDPDVNNRLLGGALQDSQMALRSALTRQNPAYAAPLDAANQSWSMFVRMRDAASRLGAKDGVFTPDQLRSAAKAQDNSVGHGGFARGDATLQNWAQAGQRTVGNSYPDSGTAGRSALMNLGGLLGTGAGIDHFAPGAVLPSLAGGAAFGAGTYGAYASPTGRAVTNWVLTAPKAPAVGGVLNNMPTGLFGGLFPALRDQRQDKPLPPGLIPVPAGQPVVMPKAR